MDIRQVEVADAEAPVMPLAKALGWPGEVVDNQDGTATLQAPDAWANEDDPCKVAISKLTGNKDVRVFETFPVSQQGTWVAAVVQNKPILILIDAGTGEGLAFSDIPADMDVPLPVTQPFKQRQAQTASVAVELANKNKGKKHPFAQRQQMRRAKISKLQAKRGQLTDPNEKKKLQNTIENIQMTIKQADTAQKLAAAKRQQKDTQPHKEAATASFTELASTRTMVLANVGSADAPQYEEAAITGVDDKGNTEIAFADGSVAVYRSQFHPAGLMPAGVNMETAARTAMTPAEKVAHAQKHLKIRNALDKADALAAKHKGKRGDEAKAGREKAKEMHARIAGHMAKKGIKKVASKQHLERTIKQHSPDPAPFKPMGKKKGVVSVPAAPIKKTAVQRVKEGVRKVVDRVVPKGKTRRVKR